MFILVLYVAVKRIEFGEAWMPDILVGTPRCDGVGSSPQDAWDYPHRTCGVCMLFVFTVHKMLIYKARASQSFCPWCLGKYPIEIWSIGIFYNSSHRKPNWDRKCTLLTQMTHFLQPRLVRGWKVCSCGGAGGEVVDIVDEVVAQDCTRHNPSRQRSYNPDATYRYKPFIAF